MGFFEDVRRNFERSDIGKVVDAVALAPARNVVKGSELLIKGDFKGAASQYVYGYYNSQPHMQTINSSSTAKEIAQHETTNTISAGFSNEWAEMSDRSLATGKGEIKTDETDYSLIVRNGVRQGVAAAGVGYATGAATKAQAATAWSATKDTATAASLIAKADKPDEAVADYLGVGDQYKELKETYNELDSKYGSYVKGLYSYLGQPSHVGNSGGGIPVDSQDRPKLIYPIIIFSSLLMYLIYRLRKG